MNSKSSSQIKYIFATILSGILWGIISIFLKKLSDEGLSSIQITGIRGILSSILLFFVLLITDRNSLKIDLKDIWMFIGTGVISLTFFSLCYFHTILQSGASIAVVLLYTSPIFVLLLSALIFKEKITLIKFIALILTFCGCILVAGLIGSSQKISVAGFLIGLCSGLGYALYSIFSRFALKKYKPITIIFYTFLFSGISIIPFCKPLQLVSIFSAKMIVPSILISVLCTVLPYLFYTFGLKGLETGKAAILVTIEPLVGTLIGIFLFKEDSNILKITGILLILISIILCGINPKKK